ncbi:hypothetical protein N4T77_09040 [Clostridium sp. CX1]|uniref:Uncharacterized protein n=1 Tax=Clostridium tanneri TaxID=3037988 RepID=A0ABU4JWQ9_9CLOT|nr:MULTISPECIES: hypothetical protein [unclassified Clostridium]MCT8976743.1 hypothetical protein [Clostridium sp. CX1]MDW8802358.1 hypothetical protein [Clostridium sp. A1-XYC3]
MAKRGSKYKLQDIIPLQTIIDTVNSSTNNVLLEIGRAVAPGEYAVRFYNDREQPRFYKNEERLRYTVQKAILISSFNHWREVIDILCKNNELELDEDQCSCLNERLNGSISGR